MVKPLEMPVTFLVGAERSGTTMLRLMLDGHPQLAFRYEFELAVDLVPESGGWPDLDVYCEYLRTYRWVDPPPRIDRSLDYPALVRSFLEQKRANDRKPLVGAVVHRNFDRLLRIWPDARFLHIVRDGRDVARSTIGMGWAGNVWTGSEHWLEAERLWDRVCTKLTPDRWIQVRYEDIVRAPKPELERICAFLGIGYHPAMLDYPKYSSYRPPNPSLARQWESTLTSSEIRLVESRIGDMLVARGYSLSGAPRLEPSLPARAALRAQCRAHRVRHAARTLGVRLWFENLVARRVGPKPWRDAVQLRTNDAMNALIA